MTNNRRVIAARKRYWKNIAAKEADGMAKQILVARQTMTIGDYRYPVGSILPNDKIEQQHLRAMIDARRAMYEARSKRHYPAPKKIEAPPPERPRLPSKPQIVADADHLESWRLTKEAAVRIFGGETSKATDWLLSFPECRDLYRLATKVGTARRAKELKRPSVIPNWVEGLV
jgi:hypothetical protein